MSNKDLAEELQKPIIKKIILKSILIFYRYYLYADLPDVQLISKFDKVIGFLCVIEIFSKHAWVIPLKYIKGISITNTFQKNLR